MAAALAITRLIWMREVCAGRIAVATAGAEARTERRLLVSILGIGAVAAVTLMARVPELGMRSVRTVRDG